MLADLLAEHSIPARVTLERETVCNISASSTEDTMTINVSAKLNPDQKDKVDAFNAAVKDKIADIEGCSVQVGVQLGAGCKYETITGVEDVFKGGKCDLEHKEGEVWLLDFWATWCPPCQAPMAHNQKMLEEHGSKWGDKLRIIGLSIDSGAEVIKNHVNDKKWNSVEHYWRSGSSCSDVYGVRGVPHVMLIDKEGTIVYKGHPAQRSNLVEDFDKLLAGELPEGCTGAAAAGGAVAMPKLEGGDLDIQKVMEEVNTFKSTTSDTLCKEMKETAKDFQRAFCVMVTSAGYDAESDSFKTDYKNYRVLVGAGDNVDKVNDWMKANIEGSFEVVERCHKM